MSAGARLAGFAVSLAVIAGAGYGAGTAVGPLGAAASSDQQQDQQQMTEMEGTP